ncbi:HNH endonuclease family protein [Ferrimonas gelatinilytica]|uniref:HNH endonuclease family protein n=1 Tax=Ferrimonas gelatinilytica TaxID=1255257 RepID=UPI003CD089B0
MERLRPSSIAVFSVIFLLACIANSPATIAEEVKLSRSGICHDVHSSYYSRTQHFQPFQTLQACLDAGGRLPGNRQAGSSTPRTSSLVRGDHIPYSRESFGGWQDDDNDCQNLRHELLIEQSTGPVTLSSDGCRALHGRWNDPYSGKVITDARLVDIDHVVPLRWAWQRGAANWSSARKKEFSNDTRNLLAVSSKLNRSKGSASPLEWLPPSQVYHCQYILRFLRIVHIYDLKPSEYEKLSLQVQKNEICPRL